MTDAELCLKEIGQRIMERRKRLGLTQEALAEKGNVTAQCVSYAEAGKRVLRPVQYQAVKTHKSPARQKSARSCSLWFCAA